ncbi:hypothetical protein GCM10023232_27100 [Sphingosinicella ginsenosidimutans]|uniref:Uncharacterized protein n=1 Tax=Allosphingosinicella ginsenosidimutans TaxID=1176539 RepID=A0A5C6TTD8_9SPHN|nr:hypothetical protein [Sphingosinicella ginsenosidimutans]TXC63684.1 hypothetical protein FRZ32_08440 [Sphingosinicella ginsenosidimutans]
MSGEEGLTNLGPVPEGMSFLEATRAVAGQRKYQLNPRHESRRLTICETLREIWRETEKPAPDLDAIRELVMAAGDYAKRMDARIKELKGEPC